MVIPFLRPIAVRIIFLPAFRPFAVGAPDRSLCFLIWNLHREESSGRYAKADIS